MILTTNDKANIALFHFFRLYNTADYRSNFDLFDFSHKKIGYFSPDK